MYFGDWALWRVRASPTGKAIVSRFVVAPLKGHKEEYYYDGASEVECTHSLFPQTSASPCWWVARHPVVFDR